MDYKELNINIEFLATCGIVLSQEKKAALHTSLTILKEDQKLSVVLFWGKILGTSGDYFIAKGLRTPNYFSEKRFYYSKDCLEWGLLNPATDEQRSTSRLIKGRFTGDPFFVVETKIKKMQPGSESVDEETISMKEEDRLAAVLEDIDGEAVVAPRGAFLLSPEGTVSYNRSFEGLSPAEAAKLCNYFHFRKAEQKNISEAQKADFDRAVDFMDPIHLDNPIGCWSLHEETVNESVTLRSLHWPGYFFFHVPQTRYSGGLYFGTGEKNIDLPFML